MTKFILLKNSFDIYLYMNNTIEIFICYFFLWNVGVTKLVFQDNDESRVCAEIQHVRKINKSFLNFIIWILHRLSMYLVLKNRYPSTFLFWKLRGENTSWAGGICKKLRCAKTDSQVLWNFSKMPPCPPGLHIDSVIYKWSHVYFPHFRRWRSSVIIPVSLRLVVQVTMSYCNKNL